jgi:hypothetical protein
MKSQFVLALACFSLMTGCKKETTTETPKKTVPIAEETLPPAPKIECYSYNENGSVISIELHYGKDGVDGNLYYGLKEKDRNQGIFNGRIENNILIADYKFQSEGTESTRQVAFQLKDGKLVEGYGEMNEDGTRFKDVSKLSFTSTMPLSKTDCPK